jgi:hypothetical protein
MGIKLGHEEVDWILLAQKRDQWRVLVSMEWTLWGIAWLAERLPNFQEGLCSMVLVRGISPRCTDRPWMAIADCINRDLWGWNVKGHRLGVMDMRWETLQVEWQGPRLQQRHKHKTIHNFPFFSSLSLCFPSLCILSLFVRFLASSLDVIFVWFSSLVRSFEVVSSKILNLCSNKCTVRN